MNPITFNRNGKAKIAESKVRRFIRGATLTVNHIPYTIEQVTTHGGYVQAILKHDGKYCIFAYPEKEDMPNQFYHLELLNDSWVAGEDIPITHIDMP